MFSDGQDDEATLETGIAYALEGEKEGFFLVRLGMVFEWALPRNQITRLLSALKTEMTADRVVALGDILLDGPGRFSDDEVLEIGTFLASQLKSYPSSWTRDELGKLMQSRGFTNVATELYEGGGKWIESMVAEI